MDDPHERDIDPDMERFDALRGDSVSLIRPAPAEPYRAPAASRDGVVLHVVLAGSLALVRRDGRALPLSAGDALLVANADRDVVLRTHGAPRGNAIGGRRTSARTAGAVELLRATYAPRSRRLPALLHVHGVDLRCCRGATVLLELLRAELIRGGAEAERVSCALLDPLLAFVVRAWREESRGATAQVLDPAVAAAIACLRARPGDPWTVVALAKAAGLSRSAFARRFASEVGAPPLRFLADWRMRVAARLLADSEDSLATIAAAVGYESEFAFSRAFKRHHGEAPGAHRRRVRSFRDPDAPMLAAA